MFSVHTWLASVTRTVLEPALLRIATTACGQAEGRRHGQRGPDN